MTLLEGDAEDVLQLGFGRHVIGIDLHHVVGALALGLQNLQRLVGVARRDDAVGHLTRQIAGHIGIAHIRQRRPVAIRAQTVGTAGADVGTSDGRKLARVFHEVHGAVGLGEGMAHGGAGRGHVLEGSGRRQPRGLLQLLHKLPGVESVEEVDEAGLAVQHLNGQVAAVLHEDARRLLVRIAAVLEFQFVHDSPIYDVSGSSGAKLRGILIRSDSPRFVEMPTGHFQSLRNSLGQNTPYLR